MQARLMVFMAAAVCVAAGPQAGAAAPETKGGHRLSFGNDASVEFAGDDKGAALWPFSVRLGDKAIGHLGFELAYEGGEPGGRILTTRRESRPDGSVAVLELADSGRITCAATVERGARGVGVAVNLKSAPGLMTHVLPSGRTTKVKRLYFGPGLVVQGIRRPATLNKGWYCSSLAVEFENGLFEFQHISQPPRTLQIDPQRNLYSFELKRTFDEHGDIVTSHGEWDRVSDDVTYTFYFTDDFMDGVRYLREKLNLPKSEVTHRLIGMQHLNLSFFGSDQGSRGHDREHVRSEGFESVRFCMDLFIRGATDLFIQGCRNNDNGDLFRLCDRYGALKSIYQQYGGLNATGGQNFFNEWSRIDAPPLSPTDLYHCIRPLLHPAGFHPQRIHGVAGHGDHKDFPMIAPHALPGLIRSHRAAVKNAFNINSIYQDVISGDTGGGYWNSQRHYVRAQAAVKAMREFFQENRAYGPVLTEFAEEAYFGYADAAYPSYVFGAPAIGLHGDDWEFFPFKDLLYHDTVVLYGAGALFSYKVGWKSKADDFALTDQERAYGELVRDARSTAILLGHPAFMNTASMHSGMRVWKTRDTDLTPFLKDYYLHHQFHKRTGLRKVTAFAFDGANLHRHVVAYEDGTRVWVNRSAEDWRVEGQVLPRYGFLIKGPGITEYSALAAAGRGRWVDYVDTPEEIYADPIGQRHDFGKVETDTQVAIQLLADGVVKIIPYPGDRAGAINVRLDRIGQRWNYGATKLQAYNGVGRLLQEAPWKNRNGLRFNPAAVEGAVFYVAHLADKNPRVRWDIGTDLKEIRAWEPRDDNLVQSPGFEEEWYGLHGWMKNPDPARVVSAIDRTERHSGNCSFKVRFQGGRIAGYKQRYQWLKLEPGRTYRLRYHIKSDGLSQGVGLIVNKPVGALHPFYRVSEELGREREHYVKGTTLWTQVETTFTADAPFMILAVHTPPGTGVSGTAWIDDVEVRESK